STSRSRSWSSRASSPARRPPATPRTRSASRRSRRRPRPPRLAPRRGPSPPETRAMARLHELFRYLVENKGSDLHLVSTLEPRLRRRGHLEAIPGWPVLSDADLRGLLREIVSAEQWHEYEETGDLDFAYGLEGVARFRGNYLRQEHGASAVFRAIPQDIIPLE